MSILVVDDNVVSAKLVAFTLKANGYKTVAVGSASEALATLSCPDDVRLIITDYMMPEMDGLTLIAKVKQMPACMNIPIIVVSAYSELETVRHARDLGCVGFLVKPVDKKQLIERVKHLLEDVPAACRDKDVVMKELAISSAEYEELAAMLAAQLAVAIPMVAAEREESDQLVSDHAGRALKELAESAAILGGERFSRLYALHKERGHLVRSKCGALLNAMQELEVALAAQLNPPPPAASNT